jgi:predicted esterase
MRLGLPCLITALLCVGSVLPTTAQQNYEVSTEWFISANGTDTLGCDLYLPEESIHPGWGVVFLHGGGFFTGSRNGAASEAYCAALAARGIPTFSIDYRLRQVGQGFHCDVSIPDKREAIRWAAEDLVAAIDALGAHFPNGIIAAGSSAGAEAVLDAVYALRLSSLKGAISLAGGVEPPQTWRDTPVLAVHGTCDALVPYCVDLHHYCPAESAGALLLAGGGGMASEGANVELHAIQYAGHELSSSMLTDPFFIDHSVDFINSVVTHTFEPNHSTIPLYRPCNLSQHPNPSCQ